MLVAWLVALAGWLVIAALPDRYEATARIYVDSTSRLDQAVERVVIDGNTGSELQRVRQTMLGRPMLERVIDTTNLHERAKTEDEKEALIRRLQDDIVVRQIEVDGRGFRDNVFSINYQDGDRATALAVVHALVGFFVEDVQNGMQLGSAEAQQFLQDQIAEYEKQLTEREQTLAEFKRRWVGRLPGESGDYFSRLEKSISELEKAEAELKVARERRRVLRLQLGLDKPPDGSTEGSELAVYDAPKSELDGRINELETTLSELNLRFTERHPDVVAVREQLDQLRAERAKALEALRANGSRENASIGSSEVFESIQMDLNDVQVEIAALETQAKDRARTVDRLRETVNEMPQVEAQLAQLTRDYTQVKEIYEELRARLEQEKLRTAVDVLGSVRFQIIDPPIVSLYPVSPDRRLLNLFCLVAAIGCGIGVAYFRNQLQPTFSSARALMQEAQIPVLGVVTEFFSPRERTVNRVAFVAFMASGLALIITGGTVFYWRIEIAESVKTMLEAV